MKQQLHATTETWDFDADSQQPTSVSIDTFYSNIEFNCQELVFDASDVPDKIRYKFTTGSEKIDASTNFFFKIISDESISSVS